MFKFKIEGIPDLRQIKIIKYSNFADRRGSLFTFFDKNIETKLKIFTKQKFVHDKFVYRKKNVLTGIHGDHKTWKIVTCLKGSILQVVVNCDKKSKNFGKHVMLNLNEKKYISILIPPNYGNAFLTTSKESLYYYKLAYRGSYLDYNKQFTYKWNDSRFNINWPIKNPILSKRDKL